MTADTPLRQFTYAQWQTYGTTGHVENWVNIYNSAKFKAGDTIIIVGVCTDRNNAGVSLYATVTSVSGTSVTATTTNLIIGGDKGAKMRMGEWKSDVSYLCGNPGEYFYDIVIYNSELYLCLISHTSSASNNPQTSVASGLGYWALATEWDFVATKLLLTDKILANQIDATGLKAVDVDISGKITATEGEIGGFTIGQRSLSCTNKYASIDCEFSGTRFLHINSNSFPGMLDVRSDDSKHAIRIQEYGTKNGIDIVCNGSGKAIDSAGEVLLEARPGEKITVKGLHMNVREISASGSIYSNDDIVFFSNSSEITVSMPSAYTYSGKFLVLKRKGTGGVKLTGAFSHPDNINNVSGYELTAGTYMMISYGSAWIVARCD